jgi:lipopolysaccharide export system permease protein
MARSHKRTWLYVGREFLLSFSVAFLFFFFIFFVNQILVMAEEIFAKRVPFWDVVRLVAYSLPWVVMMSFPFGSLVGALMAVGRIASDNEALAFAASGVPPRQLLVPLLALGVAFSAVSFVMNDYFLPLGTIRYAEIYRRIVYSNPSLEIDPLSIKKLDDLTVVTGTVEGQTFRNVVLIDRSAERNRRVITARSAHLEERERGVVSLVLEGVFTHASFPKEGDRYDYTTSEQLVYNISLKSVAASLGTPTPSQQSSVDVWRQIGVKAAAEQALVADRDARAAGLAWDLAGGLRALREAAVRAPATVPDLSRAAEESLLRYSAERDRDVQDRSLRAYLLEFHWKFAVPAGCLVFAFFAWPVGLRARRSGRSVGFAVGLFVAIAYWGMLVAGRTFGVRLNVPPAAAMWLPDAVVFGGGLVVAVVRPGGQR